MKALITGITGFAGTHLVEHLLSCGDEVLGCSRGGHWKARAPEQLVDSVRLLDWDIIDDPSNWCLTHCATFKPEVIFHLAAISNPGDCGNTEPTRQATAVNVAGSKNVCDLALRLSSRPRVVLLSSRHVYSPVTRGATSVAESFATEPSSAYGKTKLAAEGAALALAQSHGLGVVIARSFSHAGPRQQPPMMLAEWCAQLVGGESQLRVRNPNVWLDLSDVRDAVRAFRLLAEHGVSGEIYNVGSGRAVRSGDVAGKLLQLAAPAAELVAVETQQRFNPVADIRKLHRQTHWQAEIPLETTLRDTWQFWLEQNGCGQ